MAEEIADDEALYEVWRNLTPEQVDALHDLLAYLAQYRRRRDADRSAVRAIALLLLAYGLGHLPDVSESL